MDSSAARKISTSALARELQVEVQQLFSTLKDYGWIRKVDEGWVLTGKGEFEGGEYVHSKRFGRYIVWPVELVEHPLLQALEDNRRLSAAVLGKRHELNAREVNRLLAELGWIKHTMQGWELTEQGRKEGGLQLENEQSGIFYIVWPVAIDEHPVLQRQLELAAKAHQVAPKDDLFESLSLVAVDGHQHSNVMQLQVCHWLYMAGITHACQRQLPVAEPMCADFYLPAYHLYIDCWPADANGKSLAKKMQRKETYKRLGVAAIDIEPQHLQQLDEYLTRQLRKLGVRVI